LKAWDRTFIVIFYPKLIEEFLTKVVILIYLLSHSSPWGRYLEETSPEVENSQSRRCRAALLQKLSSTHGAPLLKHRDCNGVILGW